MKYKECLDYIRSDYYRIYGQCDVNIFKMWITTWLDGGFHFLFWLRLSNCNNLLVGGVSRFFYQILGLKYQISIHRQTKIVLPYKPNIPLIHSILSCKLFVCICKFLYLYTIILADIYA